MTRSILELTSPEVARQISRNPMAVIPFGSIEQHGPHLPNGTDIIAAEELAAELAGQLDALLVPFGPYGITPIHAGHPGTVSLSRPTFEALLADICAELVDMGVTQLVFLNWHEGNIAPMDAVATEIQKANEEVYVVTSHACYVAERLYAAQGGELTHGGGIEALAVLARDPGLVKVERAGDAIRPDAVLALDQMRRSRDTHGYVTDVTEIDAEGWYGNPHWATTEMASTFASDVAGEIAREVARIFSLRSDG